MALNISFPFRIDGRGRVALADEDTHVRHLIEQLLFTSPGERVNRPDFGTGLMQLVFSPSGPELAAAVEFTVQGALSAGSPTASRWRRSTCRPTTRSSG